MRDETVMRGLDPATHHLREKVFPLARMDARVKPAHDGETVITGHSRSKNGVASARLCEERRRFRTFVVAGLDPATHHLREKIFAKSMDARVEARA
jgi:hypothetical protein